MNDLINIISCKELFDKIEQDSSTSGIKLAAENLLDVINDWPLLNQTEIVDFVEALDKEIDSPLTLQKVEIYSKKLSAVSQSWKMEACESLLEVFAYDRTKTLEEIIIEISNFYKSNNY